MTQLDLDDLPPRAARLLAGLGPDEELTLIQNGAVVGHLRRCGEAALPLVDAPTPSVEADMEEIMDHFSAMIHDEF